MSNLFREVPRHLRANATPLEAFTAREGREVFASALAGEFPQGAYMGTDLGFQTLPPERAVFNSEIFRAIENGLLPTADLFRPDEEVFRLEVSVKMSGKIYVEAYLNLAEEEPDFFQDGLLFSEELELGPEYVREAKKILKKLELEFGTLVMGKQSQKTYFVSPEIDTKLPPHVLEVLAKL